jgi:hypothetical protein
LAAPKTPFTAGAVGRVIAVRSSSTRKLSAASRLLARPPRWPDAPRDNSNDLLHERITIDGAVFIDETLQHW